MALQKASPRSGKFVDLAASLPVIELCRVRSYVGTVAGVSRCGQHRLVELAAKCADGRSLYLWVSSVALDDAARDGLACQLTGEYAKDLVLGFKGRFADIWNKDRLTTDIHYPDHIWVHPLERDADVGEEAQS